MSPNDYNVVTSQLDFTDTVRTSCVMMDIIDDVVMESLERFAISLTLPNGDQFQLGTPASAAVTITDNDGKMVTIYT